MTASPNEFLSYVLEVMSHWAQVSSRKMFGGFGLYCEGLMFALIIEDELFFKADAENIAQFSQSGSHPFTYQSKTRLVQVGYWSAPAESLESLHKMSDCCQLAYAAALRGQIGKLARRARKTK
jgi:DNA transformation protein and related proteins